MMKNLQLLLFIFLSVGSFAQVTGVDYLMKYNCATNEYDVSIEVLSGSATTIPQRAQFNAQISIIVPTGEDLVITDRYMPLENNQLYNGAVPLNWVVNFPTISPNEQPESDFYSITPYLSPASFYNDLQPGDIVKLFSFVAGTTGEYDSRVRFFDNDADPDMGSSTTGGGNYLNGFTLGSPVQIYKGHAEISCLTDIAGLDEVDVKAYPNPFINQFYVEVPNKDLDVRVVGADGKVYFFQSAAQGSLIIDSTDFPSGVYFIKIESETNTISKKMVKI